jgi:outer membrane lipoprotein-sorting protein
MIPELLLLLAVSAETPDPIATALERFRDVEAYQVTLRSTAGGTTDIIHYSYKRPGYVRMDFVSPHKGVRLIYDPQRKEARVWPLGPGFFSMTLDPGNRLIRSPAGQRIDRSDIGALLQNVQALQGAGSVRTATADLSGRAALQVTVQAGDQAMSGAIHRYDLWLDTDTGLPLKVISRDAAGRTIEEVLFEDLRLDPDLPMTLFTPETAAPR